MVVKRRISRSLLNRLVCRAREAGEAEICGLLAGEGDAICEAIPLPNAAADPANGFLIDPDSHVAAVAEARRQGKRILGHYHSHPSGAPFPSPKDAASAAEQGRLWLILAGGGHGMWISKRGGSVAGAFDPVELDIH